MRIGHHPKLRKKKDDIYRSRSKGYVKDMGEGRDRIKTGRGWMKEDGGIEEEKGKSSDIWRISEGSNTATI